MRQLIDQRIARVQRELLSPTLGRDGRSSFLDQLRLLELEREDAIEGRLPPLSVDTLPFASLESIQRALTGEEAMVWFSLAPWTDLYDEFGGGAWAVSITRRTATAHPLFIDTELDAQMRAFTGLLRDRTANRDAWSPAARRLVRALLRDVLTHLPRSVKRLSLVTDGPLHQVPFEALPLEDGSLLGDRFDISVTPSATVWLRLREAARHRWTDEVLVLADPDVPEGGTPDGELHLSALPGARDEARSIARILSIPPHRTVEGSSASDYFLKRATINPFSVVRIAAHARADTAYPERSAIFLAPGDDSEDGWLQPREIAALDLLGAVVVLSACDSAEGSLIPGEGPLSLARAFFAGGASAVVATRWPLRDDDGARLMGYFYHSLSAGRTIAAAMRDARRGAENDGLPAAAWAGVVVLGDGGQVPVPAMPTRPMGTFWMGTAALMAVCGWMTWQRRRMMQRPRLTDKGHTTRSTGTRDRASSGSR